MEEMWNTVWIRLYLRGDSKGGKDKEKRAGQGPPVV